MLKQKLKESDEARSILDVLCKEQEHQVLSLRRDRMTRGLEEEKRFNEEIARRMADMEQQNDYL